MSLSIAAGEAVGLLGPNGARANAVGGVPLLLTTHDLPDVERLCGRLVVIDHGRVLVDGSLQSLRRRFGGARRLVVDLEEPATALAGSARRPGRHGRGRRAPPATGLSAEQTSAAELMAAVATRVAG